MRIQPARQRQNYGDKQIWAKQSVRRQQKCLLRAGVDDDDDNIGGMGERKRWVGNNGETMHIAIHPLHDGRIIYVKATEACTRTVRVWAACLGRWWRQFAAYLLFHAVVVNHTSVIM